MALPASRMRRRMRRYGLAWAGAAIVLAWLLVAESTSEELD